ncbi:autotransporter outer membrane beta-barrel domain-containing protein [Trinickia violacea]|uniref:autotransporter outer membrane beta-barrel domain-containing protein n=1 Tax=Trinickia violacea TaxID=2571746 RepID=UPI00158606C8|nr:autotransporter outer membrane beta-barrel domain-containing protein [Trinickia violacea]
MSFSGGWSSATSSLTPSIPFPANTVNTSFSSYGGFAWNYSLYSFTVTQSGTYSATATTSPVINTTYFLTGTYSPSTTSPSTPIGHFFASELATGTPHSATFPFLSLTAGTTYSLLIAYNTGGTQAADRFTFTMSGPGCAAFQSVNSCSIGTGSTQSASGLGSTVNPVFTGGTLQVDTSSQTYGQSFTLDNSATNTIDQSGHAVTFSGAFSDATSGGNLVVANSGSGGSVTLTGTNTYTGTTTVQSGATLALAGSGSIASSSQVTTNGTLDISQTAGTSLTTIAGSGVIALGAQNLKLTGASGTFNGVIKDGGIGGGTGGSLTMQQGSLILNGANTYSGGTVVNGGLLEVGDIDHSGASVAGNVQVNASGTLRGHGTVGGNVVNSGTVAPGGSIGTLSVSGNYSQASNAALAIEVSPTAASVLNVAGSATLNGVLAITFDPGTYTAKQYAIVSAANGVSGRFTSVSSTVSAGANLGSLQTALAYGTNQVALVLSDAVTPPVVVAPIDTSIYTALGSTASMGAQTASMTLLGRMSRASTATAATPAGWIDATGSHANVGGTNGEPGFQANRYGFLTGLEKKVGQYTVGVAGGYTHADIDEQQTGDSASIDTLRLAAYGSRWLGGVGLSATAGYGLDFLSQKRPFGATGTAEGDHVGHEFTLGGQASLPLTLGSFVVTPRVGLRYAYFHANGFGESGAGGQDLGVGTDNVHSLQPYAEVTLDKAFGNALNPVDVQLRLGYAHELLDTNRSVTVTAQDGTVFAAPGTSLPRGYLTTGVSVSMQPTKALKVSLGYDALINTTHASEQTASLKVGYQF